MTSTLRVTVDSQAVSVAETIARAARVVQFLVITDRLFGELADELGGPDAATRHLAAVATAVDTSIAVNVERDGGESTTAVISPKGWTRERLAGWIGGYRDEIEALFGTATVREE